MVYTTIKPQKVNVKISVSSLANHQKYTDMLQVTLLLSSNAYPGNTR